MHISIECEDYLQFKTAFTDGAILIGRGRKAKVLDVTQDMVLLAFHTKLRSCWTNELNEKNIQEFRGYKYCRWFSRHALVGKVIIIRRGCYD